MCEKLPKPLRIAMAIMAALAVLNFWPCVVFASPRMQAIESSHFVINVEIEDKREALQIKTILEDRIEESAAATGMALPEKAKFNVYMYPDQAAFQMRHWGMLALLFLKERYACDMRGDTLLLVSPRRPGLFFNTTQVMDSAVDLFITRLPTFLPRS